MRSPEGRRRGLRKERRGGEVKGQKKTRSSERECGGKGKGAGRVGGGGEGKGSGVGEKRTQENFENEENVEK